MDQNPTFYICVVGVLIIVALFMALVPLLRDRSDEKRGHDWFWGILIVAILAAGRWPSIVFPRELNPDECQLLAGARALVHDPVFWRSVDGGTAGPLDFFALWPVGWFFGWQTFLTARITAFVFVAIMLLSVHQSMAILLGRRVARLASLTAVCLEALSNAEDLLHYSTEIFPMMLLTVAAYSAVRRWLDQRGPLWNGLGGLLLGAIPLAKLQVVPLAASLGVGWLLAEIFSKTPGRGRRITYLLVGALFPASMFACQLTLAGEWNSFLISYVSSNIRYSGLGSASVWQTMLDMRGISIQRDSLLHLWAPAISIWIVLMLRPRRSADRTVLLSTLAGFAATLLAIYCVSFTRIPFLHYWQLAIVPTTFFVATLTKNLLDSASRSARKRDHWLVAACAFGLVVTLVVQRVRQPSIYLGFHPYLERKPFTDLSTCITPHVRPGDSIAIWGWSNFVYVETGLRQATRDAIIYNFIEPSPHRDFFRKRFLNDFINALPTFFLDSVGPYSMHYQGEEFAHDIYFPALAAIIHSHYLLVETIPGARLYQRKDLVDR